MKAPFVLVVLLAAFACGDEEAPPQGPLPIVGTWADDYGLDHAITESTWTQTGFGDTSVFDIVEYDNETHTLFAHNADANAYNPGKWSRFDWTTFEEELWYCQSVSDGATEADAHDAARRADPHSPDTEGCAGYAWSRLRVPLNVRGTYTDNWGMDHEITQTTWTQTWAGPPADVSTFLIQTFDNDAGTAIAQNDASNAYFANLWSRFDWFTNDAGLWYCQGESDAADAAAASASTPPDRGDTTSGCGGISWTKLTEAP